MKRNDILDKLGYCVPERRKKRVIILSDLKNEADDQFAVMHHLLTPGSDVRGIVACHFEWLARFVQQLLDAGVDGAMKQRASDGIGSHLRPRYSSMRASYEEGIKLLKLANMEDVPLFFGSDREITDRKHLPDSPGADFIIEEAMRDDNRPLYVCVLGCATDLAIALLKKPEIGERLTAVWIGGGAYPVGGREFNLIQDVEAARILFENPVTIWQIPENVYKTMEVSLAELVSRVKLCGEAGAYLCQQLLELNEILCSRPGDFPAGETWALGDNPTVSVLMQSPQRINWHMEKAPALGEDGTYLPNENGKPIRVYDSVDVRMTMEDLFTKLKLCYGG